MKTPAWIQALILVCGLAAPGGQALAEGGEAVFGPDNNSPAARLVVRFEGGVLGTAMAEVIDKLTALPVKSIPIKPEILVIGNDYCTVLANELAVPIDACSPELVRAVNAFSKKHGPKSQETAPGVRELHLPAIKPQLGTFSRVYDTAKEEDRRRLQEVSNQPEWTKIFLGETIRKPAGDEKISIDTRSVPNQEARRKQDTQPRTMDALVRPFAYRKPISPPQDGGAVHRLTFESYRWALEVTDKNVVPELSDLAFELSNPNRSVIVDLPPEQRQKAIRRYAVSPNALWEQCSTRPQEQPQKAFYTAFLPGSSYAESAKRCTPGGEPPQVFILDTKVAPHVDLRQSLRIVSAGDPPDRCMLTAPEFSSAPPPAAPSCIQAGTYDVDRHHGTYLSGIIASSGQTSGLVGVAADAKLNSFIWEKDIPASDKYDLLEDCSGIDKPKIFLMAGSVELNQVRPEYLNVNKTELTEQHRDKRARLSLLNKLILTNKPVFIVAAGQSSDQGRSGEELRRKGLLSPQSLGDMDNVIVVTACDGDCQGEQVKVWPAGNFSNPIDQLVHLMAPGGEAIPSFITEDRMARASGTSASSAFVAGVAAKMMACHPSYYATQSRLKAQLMLTARPNLAVEDRAKVAAGTVDPELALIDPTVSWLKTEGPADMAEIIPMHWCDRSVTVTDADGKEKVVESKRIRRITGVGGGDHVVKQLVYDDTDAFPGNPARWVMNMDGPGRLDEGALLAVRFKGRSESCTLKAAAVHDVILSEQVKHASCAAVRPCDQVR